MNINLNKTHALPLMIFVACTCAGTPLCMLSFLRAIGICSDASAVELFFPYAMLIDPGLYARAGLAFAVSLLQWPLYGVIGAASATDKRRSWLLPTCALVLVIVHVTAVIIAQQKVNTVRRVNVSAHEVVARNAT